MVFYGRSVVRRMLKIKLIGKETYNQKLCGWGSERYDMRVNINKSLQF